MLGLKVTRRAKAIIEHTERKRKNIPQSLGMIIALSNPHITPTPQY